MRFPRTALLMCMLAGVTLLQAQGQAEARGGRGWLASGLIAGVRGQYRLHEPAYSMGYDGSWYTIIATGDRIDIPALGGMAGYGAFIGFSSCENLREPAYIVSAAWSMARGRGDSAIGILDYVDHEIGLGMEMLFPLRNGFAITGQLGWDFDFFSVTNGFLPSGGNREDLLLSSFVGGDFGLGLAYVTGRRFLLEAKAVIRGGENSSASGGGVSDSLGGEIGRMEYSFELSAGWIF